MGTYILLHYLHRDDGNYKEHGTALFINRKGLAEDRIVKELKDNSLDRDGAFLPRAVGMRALYGDEHEWHEVVGVESAASETIEDDGLADVADLIRRFKRMRKKHIAPSARRAIPPVLSLVSDVLSVLHELWTALYTYRGKVVLVAVHLDDFHTIEETLTMDSESYAFDPEIRHILRRGLKRMKEVDIKPIFDLRKRLMRIQKRAK
jgi:hypothetical protein